MLGLILGLQLGLKTTSTLGILQDLHQKVGTAEILILVD